MAKLAPFVQPYNPFMLLLSYICIAEPPLQPPLSYVIMCNAQPTKSSSNLAAGFVSIKSNDTL